MKHVIAIAIMISIATISHDSFSDTTKIVKAKQTIKVYDSQNNLQYEMTPIQAIFLVERSKVMKANQSKKLSVKLDKLLTECIKDRSDLQKGDNYSSYAKYYLAISAVVIFSAGIFFGSKL